MTPEDPRHGKEAGYAAHGRAGQKPCARCNRAKLRGDKRRRVLGPALQPVPADVLVILSRYSDRVLERRSGVSTCALQNMRKRGDRARAYPETIARLRSVRVPTDIGSVRRVQALARLGWSCPQIAEVAGVPMTTIARVRDHDGRQHLGRDTLRDAIARAYAEMSMTVPPWTRWSSRISSMAEAAGWPPPLAWDDDLIDDPSARPSLDAEGAPPDELDEAVILRMLAGDRLPSTRLEKVEAMRRWLATGRSEKSLCDTHGWQYGRYTTREAGAA